MDEGFVITEFVYAGYLEVGKDRDLAAAACSYKQALDRMWLGA
jgi:hypothetical protein